MQAEELEAFVSKLRAKIGSSLEVESLSESERVLLSPTTVTVALIMSAADYCEKSGVTFVEFTDMLRNLCANLDSLVEGSTSKDHDNHS